MIGFIKKLFKNKVSETNRIEESNKSILNTEGMILNHKGSSIEIHQKNAKEYLKKLEKLKNTESNNVLFENLFGSLINERGVRYSYPASVSYLKKSYIEDSYESIEKLFFKTKYICDLASSKDEIKTIATYYNSVIKELNGEAGICPQTLTISIDKLISALDFKKNPAELIGLTSGLVKDFLIDIRNILIEKKRQLIKIDSYGFSDKSLWEKEKVKIISKYVEQTLLQKYFNTDNDFIINLIFTVSYVEMNYFEASLDNSQSANNIHVSNKEKGENYEDECLNLLKVNSWDVLTTSSSGDKGVDLLAIKNDIKLAIQCKNWNAKIGTSAVQEIYTGKKIYSADIAVILSETELTKQAMEIAENLNVILINKREINLIDSIIKNRFY